ncbi:hypothetical protein C8J56DRAFT_839501, partial [Mycena floridula]
MIYDDSTGAIVTDLIAIAEYLDITYPEKPLVMPAGTYSLHMALIAAVRGIPVYSTTAALCNAGKIISRLTPRAGEHCKKLWETRMGGKIDDIQDKYHDGLEAGHKWYKEGKLTLVGTQIEFADMLLGAYLKYCKSIWGEESESWKRLSSFNRGKWANLVGELGKY